MSITYTTHERADEARIRMLGSGFKIPKAMEVSKVIVLP